MKLTRSEKLLEQYGKPVECDICHKKQAFGYGWLMTTEQDIVCPACQNKVTKKGETLVSI